MKPEDIARVCHAANRELQLIQGDPAIPTAPPWEECGQEMRASAVDGVAAVVLGAGPEESHENWVRFKVTHGWTLGPVKDEAARRHPLLIPYDDLPAAQKVKDALFGAIVAALGPQDDSGRLDGEAGTAASPAPIAD